jgi:hypothetical protein
MKLHHQIFDDTQPDGLSISVPPCSEENRQKKKDSWLVVNSESNKTYRRCDNFGKAELELNALSANVRNKYELIHELGANTRCMEYCAYKSFCEFGKSLK